MAGQLDHFPNDGDVADIERLQRRLAAELYRFDCPDPGQLYDFVMRILDGKTHAQVQAHLIECGSCRDEVALLRQAGAPAESQATAHSNPSLLARLNAVLTPTSALVFRGADGDGDDAPLTYTIDPPGWELHLSRRADSQGYVLSGQLIGPADDELAQLVAVLALDGDELERSALDDTGYFTLHCKRAAKVDLTIESERVRITANGIQLGTS